MYTWWRDLCHIFSSLNKTRLRKLGRILVQEHLFGSWNCDLKLKEKKRHFSNFSSRKAFICISLVQTHSVWSRKTDVSCRSSPASRGAGTVHHTWLVNKQRISASPSQIHPFTRRTFFSGWGSKMPITVYSPCPQALIYLGAALLSIPHYKINLYLSKKGIFIS